MARDTTAADPTAATPADLDTTVPAVLLRLDHNPLHHGTLGIIRSLGRAGVPVHAMLEDPSAPAAHSRHLRKRHPQPAGDAAPAHILDALRNIAAPLDERPVLLTTDDAGAVLVAEHADALRPHYRFPPTPPHLPRELADKQTVAALCDTLDVPHPTSRLVDTPAEAHAATRELRLPAIAKWTRPWLLPPHSGLRSTQLVQNTAHVVDLLARGAGTGSRLLLQRRIPPSPRGDWFFHGYLDAEGRCLFDATGRKERAWPPHAGLTCLGRWLPHPTVRASALRLLTAVGHRGAADLDFRLDPDTGAAHLLDVNPRLGAQFRLFTDATGVDLARVAHLEHTGRPVPPPIPQPGRALLVENYDPASALRLLSQGALRPGAWARSLRDVRECGWWARDDPAPFTAMTRHTAGRVAQRVPRPGATRRTSWSGETRPITDDTHREGGSGEPSPRPAMPETRTSTPYDLVVLGAGPYGLSVAAHARAGGLRTRVLGRVMETWSHHMPQGMFLKSESWASHLSDPAGAYDLGTFSEQQRRPYAAGVPVPVQDFVDYGHWFRQHAVGDVTETEATSIAGGPGRFVVHTADGDIVRARALVLAVGVTPFAHVPEPLDGLPADVCSHAADQHDLSGYAGRKVAVVGAGQSALELVALLAEAGAQPHLVARAEQLRWNSVPTDGPRGYAERLRAPQAGLGPGWPNWIFSRLPAAFHQAPTSARMYAVDRALGPAGAWWLRDRVEGRVPRLLGHHLQDAKTSDDGVRLLLEDPGGYTRGLDVDHVIAATGYRVGLDRLRPLDAGLRGRIRQDGGYPTLDRNFQSSVQGLYVVGLAASGSFGPVMRFVYGAPFAAHRVAGHLVRRWHRSAGARAEAQAAARTAA